MTEARLRRLAALEAAVKPILGGVLDLLPDETVEAAVDRTRAAGRRGQFLAIPAPMTTDEWELMAAGLPAFQEACRQQFHAEHGPLPVKAPSR